MVRVIQKSLFEELEDTVIEKRHRRKTFEDYGSFVGKFKAKKTTDDCYTPQPVYDAVLSFCRRYFSVAGRPIVRPFYPGGDYEHYDYPEGCVVIDNPPFSIYSAIVRFYLERGIDFFLFAPHLTAFVKDADCSYVLTGNEIIYENGAKVRTSFVTSMLRDTRIWTCPELAGAVLDAQQRGALNYNVYVYPDNVVTSALLGKILHEDLKIKKSECHFISNLDFLRKKHKSLFGTGFLVSDAVAEKIKNAYQAKCLKKSSAVLIELSEYEKGLIAELGGNLIRSF